MLISISDSVIEFVHDENGVLLGIFFQDSDMKKAFDMFPEIIMVDATYNLNDLRMPLFLILVIDNHGESEIAATFLVANEYRDTLTKFVTIFKENNVSWEKTNSIMTDKDMCERSVFREQFPNAILLLCRFHVARAFRREVTCEKMGITTVQRELALQILSNMLWARSVEEYDKLKDSLQTAGLDAVHQYIETHWDSIKSEWVAGLQQRTITYGTHTNNRIESMNSKIKSVCTVKTKLPQMYREMLTAINSLRSERDGRMAKHILKRPVNTYAAGSTEEKYLKHLTPYAFTGVLSQLELLSKVQLVVSEEDSQAYVDSSSYGRVQVNHDKCGCPYYTTMGLPCRHLLAYRQHLGMDLYVPEKCQHRWTRSYKPSNVRRGSVRVTEARTPRTKPVSRTQKFKQASNIAMEIANGMADMDANVFKLNMQALKHMRTVVLSGGHGVFIEGKYKNNMTTI